MGVIPEQNSVNTLVRISNRLFWSTVSLETFSNWWVANLRSFWNRTKARVSSQENLKQKKLFRQGSLQKLAVGWKKTKYYMRISTVPLLQWDSHSLLQWVSLNLNMKYLQWISLAKCSVQSASISVTICLSLVFDWWFLLVDFLTNQNDLDYSLRLIENKSISLL